MERLEASIYKPMTLGRVHIPYPTNIAKPTSVWGVVGQWSEGDIARHEEADMALSCIAFRPSRWNMNHTSCMAFGNHWRVSVYNEEHGYISFDCGLAESLKHRCGSSRRDTNKMEAELGYVSILQEIIVTIYGREKRFLGRVRILQIIAACCQWKKTPIIETQLSFSFVVV